MASANASVSAQWCGVRTVRGSAARLVVRPTKADVVDAVRVRAAEPDVAALAAGGGGGAHQRGHHPQHGAREIHRPSLLIGAEVDKPGLVEREADEPAIHRVHRRGGVDAEGRRRGGSGGGGAQQQH